MSQYTLFGEAIKTNNPIRTNSPIRFDGPKAKPKKLSEVCCTACYMAKKDECKCKCGGVYHGLGVKRGTQQNSSVETIAHKTTDPELPTKQETFFRDQLTKSNCEHCGDDLCGLPINYFEHADGWTVKGFQAKLWLYIQCDSCGHRWALWKLGVPRT